MYPFITIVYFLCLGRVQQPVRMCGASVAPVCICLRFVLRFFVAMAVSWHIEKRVGACTSTTKKTKQCRPEKRYAAFCATICSLLPSHLLIPLLLLLLLFDAGPASSSSAATVSMWLEKVTDSLLGVVACGLAWEQLQRAAKPVNTTTTSTCV